MALAARDASAAGRVVIVAGGDGTVSLAADALVPSGGTLGIIPLGTANDLARELGLPATPAEAAAVIARGTVHRTDLVGMNGRCFTTVGGLGLVSRSTVDAARMRTGRAAWLARALGAAIYRVAATRGLFGRQIDDTVWLAWRDADTGRTQRRALDVHGIFITNHATCGGGLVIPTGARADDGLFELALVPRTSRPRLLVALARLSAGLPLAPGTLVVIRTDHAIIETGHDDRFVADGEILGRGRRFELSARPGAIGILR